MARGRGKKALYEVIGNSARKGGSGTGHMDRTGPVSGRSRAIRFCDGRVELCTPYQVAAAALLLLVLLVMLAFRLGQACGKAGHGETEAIGSNGQEPAVVPPTGHGAEDAAPAAPTVDRIAQVAEGATNRIVIQTYRIKAHLEPVRDYYAGQGIETIIKKIGDWYYLVTQEKYENPDRPGTEGYRVKQRIIELGAGYQAPQGYETFGNRPFHDAYGMNFGD